MNSRISIILLSTILLSGSFGIALPKAFAVVTPSLGEADSFAILAHTYTNSGGLGMVLNGDLGYTVPPAVGSEPTVNGITFVSPDPTYLDAVSDRNDALGALAALNPGQCDFSFGAATVLDDLPQPLTPGVYCITGLLSINSGITLNGDGDYIFIILGGGINTVADSVVTLANGADACNIFWVPVGATTLGEFSVFKGNVLSDAAITVSDEVIMNGRILSFGAVTTGPEGEITVPTSCETGPVPPPTNGAVGGAIIPIDMTSLFVAGAMTNVFWVLPTLGGIAGAAIALFKVKRKSS